MTKTHFEQAARIVDAYRLQGLHEAARVSAEAFIKLFQANNPRFDKARFMKACGL